MQCNIAFILYKIVNICIYVWMALFVHQNIVTPKKNHQNIAHKNIVHQNIVHQNIVHQNIIHQNIV